MLDPEAITRLARKLAELYEGVEVALLVLVARRLAQGLDDPGWAKARLREAGAVRSEARRIVARLRREREREVVALIAAAHGGGAAAALAALRRSRTRVAATGRVTATLSRRDSAAAQAALSRALSGRLAEGDLRILRAAPDLYRAVIGRVTAQGLVDGVTRRATAQAALDLFAGQGITGFVDAAGKSWNLASYAEMACRTAAHNAARQGVFDGVRSAGRDLVIVSGSPSCCDMCAPWEGQVLSIDGATPGYPTVAEAEAEGLYHPNCAHSADPYIEGLTRRSATQYGDPERYAAQQQQRYLERGVRGWKMRQAGALDDLAAAKAKAHVREWQGRLREHVAKHDLPRLRYREQIGKAI